MPVYKNKPEKQPKVTTVTNGHVTESRIELDVHSGTHVDAPLHMINDGATFEAIPIENLVGECKVFDLSHIDGAIVKKDIDQLNISNGDFILFKTKNSQVETFDFEFVYLGEEAAKFLCEVGIRGVGIDALGIERSQPGHPTHKAFFSEGVIVIEGIRLKELPEGTYFMVAAPIKLVGTDAAPARVLLFDKI
jgi:arylformamidase